MSANPPSQARQQLSKSIHGRGIATDDVAKIWTAFGKYISKTLKSGKGIGIPKFGQFTFTPIKVDLAGSTNPEARDLQIREPIFQIARDFTPGLEVKPG